jgi:HlyD family secretion protein
VKKRVGPILALLVLIGAGVAFWRYRATHHAPDVVYKTVTAAPHRIVGKVTASGTLSAIVTVQVGTQVSGRIQRLMADFNSQVKKGQLVAKIDPQIFEASVAQAQANFLQGQASVVNAQAQAKNADLQLARTQALRNQNLAAQADLDTAEATAAMAHASIDMQKANLAQAAASLHSSQVNLSYTNIVSPIDGVVISRSVDVNVAEGDVGRLQVGMATYFTVDSYPGQRFRGKIREIRNSATTVQSVVTYDAVIDVDNSDLRLRPGMTANVTVIYAQRDGALSIPNAALRYRPPQSLASASASASGSGGRNHHSKPAGADDAPEARSIWVMRNGAPQSVSVHTGLSDGSLTEVVDGDLKEGDEVVTEANGGDSQPSSTSSSRMPRGFM